MTKNRDRLQDGLSDLTLIDRIIVSVENFVFAMAKGIALTPQGEIGNLKQLTQCSLALRTSLRKVENGTLAQDEKYMLESIYHSCQENVSVNLAQDTINCTLNMAGYDIGRMNQFEKAHVLMDMAMELKAYRSYYGEAHRQELGYEDDNERSQALAALRILEG